VQTVGIGARPECNTPFSPIRTEVYIDLPVKDLLDDDALAELTAIILSLLSHLPVTQEFGFESARLRITFIQGLERRMIDTGYTNALTAYNEGLSGEVLVEAVGRLLPATLTFGM